VIFANSRCGGAALDAGRVRRDVIKP